MHFFSYDQNFNQNISNWDTSSVTLMYRMFMRAASFNQDINNWDTSKVTRMNDMFMEASSFDQNLGSWRIMNLTSAEGMFRDITLSTKNYDALLIGWQKQSHRKNVNLGGGKSKYTAKKARGKLKNDGWRISDGGQQD